MSESELINYLGRTPGEWAQIEALEHDAEYAGAFPFGLDTLVFSVERALWFEDYADKPGRRLRRGNRTKRFFEMLDLSTLKDKRILDIGCGFGQYSVLLAKLGANVVGVELSPVAVDRAREMALATGVSERCEFVAGDFTQQTFEQASFDIVLMHEVFHHAI